MSSTGIDRVVKKTLRLSLSLGAVVAQRARSTRCHELPLGSASEYCDRGAGCLGFGRVASAVGWRAPCTWDATSRSHNAARKA